MFSTKVKKQAVTGLAVALGAFCLGGFCAMGPTASADSAVEPDHKVAYYVQGYKAYGADNKVEWTELPSGIGIKTLPSNQYHTNNRFNDSRNDSNPYALHPEAQDGGYGGDGKLWGLYYFAEIQHDSYGSGVVGESDALYNTPFKSEVSTGSQDWGANQPIIYKFEMDDTTTEYDVVLGANSTALSAAGWGNGITRTNEVFINAETTARGSYSNTLYSNYTEIHNVTAVEEECIDGVTRNILTITVRAAEGGAGPSLSFLSIADEHSTEPAYLSAEGTVINLDENATALPSTVDVLTTAGVKAAPVTWTDTSDFDNSLNRYLLNTVNVTGTVNVSGFEYSVTVPVQFTRENVYYYLNATTARSQPMTANTTFEAMRAASSGKMINDTMSAEAADNTWGVVNGTYMFFDENDTGWAKQSVYNVNPYASLHKTEHCEVIEEEKVRSIVYQFPNLPVGKYTVSVGAREPDNWGGSRTMRVYANGEKLGDFPTTAYVNSLSEFTFEQTVANEMLTLTVCSKGIDKDSADWPEDVWVGFIVISEYVEPSSEINYGNDTDQEYFLNAGDSASARVSGIGRPYYQTSFSRAYNAPNGGEVTPDETGRAWGYYYNDDMAAGYYASVGQGATPFASTIYTNIDAANREIIFKFDMKDVTTEYDVVIGFSDPWGADNGNHRGANITINGAAESAAVITNLGYNKAVFLSHVKAAALDADTGRENVLTIALNRVNEVFGSEPMVSFISIRESGKTPVYIGGAELVLAVEKNATALPSEVEVLTTAGYQNANVIWTDESGFNNRENKYFLGTFEATGTVTINEQNYPVTAKCIYVDTQGAYYYVDTTILDANGNTFLAPLAQVAFDAMKANGTLLNDKADAKATGGSWGNLNVNDTQPYYGYDENPYVSVMESVEQEGGLYWLMYSFPSLKEGDYLVQIGVRDPWGPRPSNVMINGSSVGTLTTQTRKDVMTSFLFTQDTDDAAVKLDMTGVDGQLAGFIVIRRVDGSVAANSLSIVTNANNFFFTKGTDIDVTGLSVLVDMGDYTFVRTVTRDMVSGYDADTVGEQTVTVTYAGKTVQYTVTVLEDGNADDGNKDNGGGCRSELGAVSAAVAGVVLVGAVALVLRKKREH